MVSNIELSPCPVLKPFVRRFSFRELDTNGQQVIKPLHALHEFYMSFFLDAPPIRMEEPDGKTNALINTSVDKYVVGLQSFFTGDLCLCGHMRFFSIEFTPTGFHRIFNIPLVSFTNMVVNALAIFNYDVSRLMQQLQEAADVNQMARHTENFLLTYLTKSKTDDPYNAIQTTSRLIFKDAGKLPVNIKQLAYDANMCLKTFERKFLQQVGLPPKLFARIVRFNKAVTSKTLNPKKDWTDITYDFGYSDQMHLIKDFKEFANNTPFNFFKNTPPPKEELLKG